MIEFEYYFTKFILMLIPLLFIGFIIICMANGYISAKILTFRNIRGIFAILNLIYVAVAIVLSFIAISKAGDTGCFIAAGLIIFGALQWFLINNDKLADILYFHRKNMAIWFLNSFKCEIGRCGIEIIKENGWKNIYCYESDKINKKVCVIRGIDNVESTTFFMSLLYENFFKNDNFYYPDFVQYAKNNGMFIKEYEINTKNVDYEIKHIDKFLAEKGISAKINKLNINTATELEITNLPLINAIMAKRIVKHIKEEGEFKSFWEFAKFAKISPNQGLILSKLVFAEKGKEQKTEKEKDRSLDL